MLENYSVSNKFVNFLEIYLFCHLFIDFLVENMKAYPFSLLVDGSNDSSLEKINPLTVKIFGVKR